MVLWFRVVCVLLCGVCLVIDIRLLLIVLNTSPIGAYLVGFVVICVAMVSRWFVLLDYVPTFCWFVVVICYAGVCGVWLVVV